MKPGGIFAALCAVLGATSVCAQTVLPTSGVIQVGSGTVQQPTATTLVITTTTANSIINWNTFSIGSGGIVTFIQPSSSSVTLNRVTGGSPTQIFGAVNSNGQVFFANPSGLLLGPGAQVNTAGFLATTGNISDASFLAGSMTPNGPFIQVSEGFAAVGTVQLSGDSLSFSGVTTVNVTTGVLLAGGATTANIAFGGITSLNTLAGSNVGVATVNSNTTNSTTVSLTGTSSSAQSPQQSPAAGVPVVTAAVNAPSLVPAVSVNLQKREPLY